MEYYHPIHWYFVIGISLLAASIVFAGMSFWYYFAIFAPMEQNIRRETINRKVIAAIEEKYCMGPTYANEGVKKYCEYSRIVSSPKFPTPTSTAPR